MPAVVVVKPEVELELLLPPQSSWLNSLGLWLIVSCRFTDPGCFVDAYWNRLRNHPVIAHLSMHFGLRWLSRGLQEILNPSLCHDAGNDGLGFSIPEAANSPSELFSTLAGIREASPMKT